ncbi:SprT family zinc-dependent metalloprotease [Marinomonas sp. TI.3.20]|uniref:M48 family metallopeptidase n=1 Tax=Marinomonas sp. TI.3.20 TaxID=3121296 RepID=UPI00311FD288
MADSEIIVSGIRIHIVRKAIKNLHLGVYPPEGHVRVAVPEHVTDERIRLAVIDKLAWIKKQQADFMAQPRQSAREMVAAESHYFFGKSYRLEVIEQVGKHKVELVGGNKIRLSVTANTSTENRLKLMSEWYRERLKQITPKLIDKWQAKMSVVADDWGIKKMKTKWGGVNIEAKRIWLNLDLAKKPPECLEYIIVHELVHLLERHHNSRFIAYMDEFMPKWRLHRETLNQSPLSHAPSCMTSIPVCI